MSEEDAAKDKPRKALKPSTRDMTERHLSDGEKSQKQKDDSRNRKSK